MAKELDVLLGAGFGYLLGQGPYQEWKPFIDNVGKRISHLQFMKIIVPAGVFKKIPSLAQTYHEAVNAFIYGLPNAAVPVVFKCLELSLKKKYEEIEKKSPKDLRSEELIDWGESLIQKKNKHLAHWVRSIRNYLHGEELVQESEAYQAIANVTTVLNLLFPYTETEISFVCMKCKKPTKFIGKAEQNFLGNVVLVNCDQCQTAINLRILV